MELCTRIYCFRLKEFFVSSTVSLQDMCTCICLSQKIQLWREWDARTLQHMFKLQLKTYSNVFHVNTH